MKTVINLVDDYRPGGIRSLLDDMSAVPGWQQWHWEIAVVDSSRAITLEREPDVIVVHYSMAWRKLPALALLKLRYRRARLIIVEHHYTRSFEGRCVSSPPRFRAMLRACYALAHRVIAVSNPQADWLRSIDAVCSKKISVIPSCRDYSAFLEIPRVERASPDVVIGAMGSLVPDKGFDVLIRAMRELPTDRFRLRLAGSGDEEERLRELAADLSNVEFVGHADNPAEFLAGCDLLAMPSRNESFGLVCAEAKAAGLPVVVSNVDALPQQARGCGVVVEPDDASALAKGIDYVSNPYRRRNYGERARKSVVNAWSQYLNAWSQTLNEVSAARAA